MSVRGDRIHGYESVHVLRDNDLLVPKPLTEYFGGLQVVGRGQCEPRDGFKGSAVKKRTQIIEFVNI